MGEGGMPPSRIVSVSIRKMWAISGLLSSVRLGSNDNDIKLTTWVSLYKRIMGSTGGNKLTAWVTLSNERVGSTKDGLRSTIGVSLSNGRVGSTKDRI
jgi:hypothetical protein